MKEGRATADGGGETKLQLRGRRNLCVLQQWRSQMEEKKLSLLHAKKINSGAISFKP